MSSTPHEVREYQRKAQRCIRLAVNTLNRGRDAWEEASKSGRGHVTDCINAVIEDSAFPTAKLGALAKVPQLLDAVHRKLLLRRKASLVMADQELEQLVAAEQTIQSAAASIHELAASMGEGSPLVHGAAVFHSLPLSTYGALFDEIAAMHSAELGVKRQIIGAVAEEAGEQKQRGQAGGKPQPLELLRTTLNVYVATWLLEPEIEDERLEEIRAIVMEEMRGF
mmetsp:Transcript_23095/g.58025  ORF Transcript_23095/g.58025 Transcript_23095/m.58025 type:complete len:224 (-) Transcript_23095:306-977(-)